LFISKMPRRLRKLPPKCKVGKVCMHKAGSHKVTYIRGTTNRGKKNLPGRKPQKKNKANTPLASITIE